MNKVINVDIDGTLTIEKETVTWSEGAYKKAIPNKDTIARINHLFDEGHQIVLWSARLEEDRKVTVDWMKKHGVKYTKLVLDKPFFNLYICDRVCHVNDLGKFDRLPKYVNDDPDYNILTTVSTKPHPIVIKDVKWEKGKL